MNCERQTQKSESIEGNPVDTKSGDCHHLNSLDVLSKQAASPGKGDAKSAKEPDEQTQLNSFNDYNNTHNEPPIGDATMDDAGTIKVRIRMMGGMHADGSIEYAKGSEHYDKVLKHLGGLKPGEYKLVPPWPDEPEAPNKGKRK